MILALLTVIPLKDNASNYVVGCWSSKMSSSLVICDWYFVTLMLQCLFTMIFVVVNNETNQNHNTLKSDI